jgi:hypothetical protein
MVVILWPCLVPTKIQIFFSRFHVTSNLIPHIHGVLNIDEKIINYIVYL